MDSKQGLMSEDRYLGELLAFFFQAVRKYLLMVILLPPVVAVLAYFLAQQLPPVYGAQASIRLGRADGVAILSPQAAAARINSKAFKQRVLQSINVPLQSDLARTVAGGLVAGSEAADSVTLGAQASSAQQVRQVLEVTVQLLNEEQDKAGAPLVADIKEQLAASDAKISGLLQAQENLLKRVDPKETQSGDAASASFRAIWLLDLVSRNEERLAGARVDRQGLVSRLGSWRNYPTTLTDGAFISAIPVSPRVVAIAAVAGMLTFLICILFALMRQPKNADALAVRRPEFQTGR